MQFPVFRFYVVVNFGGSGIYFVEWGPSERLQVLQLVNELLRRYGTVSTGARHLSRPQPDESSPLYPILSTVYAKSLFGCL